MWGGRTKGRGMKALPERQTANGAMPLLPMVPEGTIGKSKAWPPAGAQEHKGECEVAEQLIT